MSSRRAAQWLAARVSNALFSAAGEHAILLGAPARFPQLLAPAVCAAAQQGNALYVRSFHGSGRVGMSSALATALKEEIKHEEGGYEKPDAIAGGPPAPFKLSEAPGDTMLTLTRSFDGGETVRVDLHVNNQPAVEPTEDGEALSTVVFNVTVTKGDQSLVFECESDGTWTSINHISQEPKDADPLPDSFYTGPVFDELDDGLQNQFRAYLEARGINSDLGEYLRHLVHDKEQREYMGWLKRVQEFVSK